MPVFIRTRDGLVKEYPVGSPAAKDPPRSKCGDTGCGHLDCAIEYAKEMAALMRLILGVIVLVACSFIFIVLLVISYHWPEILDRAFWMNPETGMGFVLFVIIFSFILYYGYLLRQAKKSLEELLEFQERGTVNSLPARQVSGREVEEGQ